MTEHEVLLSLIDDKMQKCENEYSVTHTRFLNLSERSAAEAHCRGLLPRHIFHGGYPDAERTVMFFIPDYIESLPEKEDPLCVVSCRVPSASRALSHRDYLGSLLALGLTRDVIGDILVSENGAQIVVMQSVAEYILANYEKAGTVPLKVSIGALDTLCPPVLETETVRESVASLRLDNMLCAAFNLSRSNATEAISKKLVFVNDTEMSKPDMKLNVGDKLVLRGKGKAYFRELGGTTRKGRLSVILEIYR
ncbi:MAG: RNA-binding protein [Clostridia bacterium]|nr:RNA-binding protein [Clostridia bacterium]